MTKPCLTSPSSVLPCVSRAHCLTITQWPMALQPPGAQRHSPSPHTLFSRPRKPVTAVPSAAQSSHSHGHRSAPDRCRRPARAQRRSGPRAPAPCGRSRRTRGRKRGCGRGCSCRVDVLASVKRSLAGGGRRTRGALSRC